MTREKWGTPDERMESAQRLRAVRVVIEYENKFALIFGREPDADHFAKLNVIIKAHENGSEASLRLALETWLINGPRNDHAQRPTD